MHVLMLQFLSIIKSSLATFLLLMHNECSVQKYKETKARTQVKYGRSSVPCFDETERAREGERDVVDKAVTENVLCCDSGCLYHCVLRVFI